MLSQSLPSTAELPREGGFGGAFLAGDGLDTSPPRVGPGFTEIKLSGYRTGGPECKSCPRPDLSFAPRIHSVYPGKGGLFEPRWPPHC